MSDRKKGKSWRLGLALAGWLVACGGEQRVETAGADDVATATASAGTPSSSASGGGTGVAGSTAASGGAGGQGGASTVGVGGAGGAEQPLTVSQCFANAYVNAPAKGPNYDQFGPQVGSHCLGTNHQDIDKVERVVFLGDSVTVGRRTEAW